MSNIFKSVNVDEQVYRYCKFGFVAICAVLVTVLCGLYVSENILVTQSVDITTEQTDEQFTQTIQITSLGNADSVIIQDANFRKTISTTGEYKADGEYTIYAVKNGEKTYIQSGGYPNPVNTKDSVYF